MGKRLITRNRDGKLQKYLLVIHFVSLVTSSCFSIVKKIIVSSIFTLLRHIIANYFRSLKFKQQSNTINENCI